MAATIHDLSPTAQETFGQVVFWAMDEYGVDFQRAYRGVLEAWGLQCSHPPPQRAPLKPWAFECGICRSYVVETPTPKP